MIKSTLYSIVNKDLLRLLKTMVSPFQSEWSDKMTKMEYEYRKEVPEGRVVDKLKEYLEAALYVSNEESARLWQEVLKVVRDFEEYEVDRIIAAQAHYERKYGKVKDNDKETLATNEAIKKIQTS